MNDGEAKEKLLEQYDLRHHVYEGLKISSERLLNDLLRSEQLKVVGVTGRVKDRKSLAEKLSRPDKNYKDLADVTDIVGLRVVTFFEDDVDKVAGLIARELELIPEHCVDKRAALEPDRFGYRSLHYVCRLGAIRRGLFENAEFQNQVIEIQIRSILQHAWAEIEHDLGYKGEITIPNEIRRQLSRVAGLLETADRDFREVRDRSSAYRQRVTEEISRNELSGINLDSISYSEFISTSPIVLDLNNFLTAELGYPVEKQMTLSLMLEIFQSIGIDTIEKLKNQVERNALLLKEYARVLFGTRSGQKSALPGTLSLFHLAQIVALEKGGVDNLAKFYADFSMKNSDNDDDLTAARKTQSQVDEAHALLASRANLTN